MVILRYLINSRDLRLFDFRIFVMLVHIISHFRLSVYFWQIKRLVVFGVLFDFLLSEKIDRRNSIKFYAKKNYIKWVLFCRWGGGIVPYRTIRQIFTFPRVFAPHPRNLSLLFWTPFAHFGTTVVLLRIGDRLAIWPLHIHIRVRFTRIVKNAGISVLYLRGVTLNRTR